MATKMMSRTATKTTTTKPGMKTSVSTNTKGTKTVVNKLKNGGTQTKVTTASGKTYYKDSTKPSQTSMKKTGTTSGKAPSAPGKKLTAKGDGKTKTLPNVTVTASRTTKTTNLPETKVTASKKPYVNPNVYLIKKGGKLTEVPRTEYDAFAKAGGKMGVDMHPGFSRSDKQGMAYVDPSKYTPLK